MQSQRILEVIYSGGDPEKHQNRVETMKQERKKANNKEGVNGAALWVAGVQSLGISEETG